MGLLSDLADEVEAYPHTFLQVEIVDVDPPGDVQNEEERVPFRIQVSNSGPLDVDNLSLLVEGLNGTEVQSNGTNQGWRDSFTISGEFFGDVPAHSADDGPVVSSGEPFHFRQGADFETATDLVRVSVANWTSSFDHYFTHHTPADPEANAVHSARVFEEVG